MNDFPTLEPSSTSDPADDLISRHFDEPLSPEDHQRLTKLLHDDPQALHDFVATARLHRALDSLGPAQPARRKGRPLRWIGIGAGAAAAAAAVITGGWVIFQRNVQVPHQQARVTVEDIVPPPRDSVKPDAVNVKKRIVKTAGATALNQPQPDLDELLERYFVNVTPHGLTVAEALKQLEQAIREVNILNRPALNQLSFAAGASIEPGVEDPLVRTPLTPPLTVKTYLEACGLFRQVTRQPGNVVYGLAPLGSGDNGELITKSYRVPPDFPATLSRKLRPAAAGSSDPFEKPAAEGSEPSIWSVVSEFFVNPQEKGASAHFKGPEAGASVDQLEEAGSGKLRDSGARLVVRGSSNTLTLLDKRWEFYWAHQPMTLIFVTGAVYSAPRTSLPSEFDEASGTIFTQAEGGDYLKTVKTAAAGFFSMPSIISRPGQRSKVEIIREVPQPPSWTETHNMGLTVGVEAVYSGELIKLEGTVELSFLGREVVRKSDAASNSSEGTGLEMDLREPEVSDGKVHSFQTEYELWLPDQSSGLFTLDVPLANGQVAAIQLTATSIDPQGNPIKAQPIPYGIPIEGRPGFVRSPYSTAGEVDITGIPSGTKVLCPYTKKTFRVP
ncbi:MAG: hypothetical protein EOP86_15930 [Verrucomicrobiaceae bacterium]|nr:MAG: hypothetical protein EOP86_15930 [Verrucomicrobiaceae bacterium]